MNSTDGSPSPLARTASLPRARWTPRLVLALRASLLALAALALRRELAGVNVADLLRGLRSYGVRHVAFGLALTAASFLTLGIVELLALRYAGRGVARLVPPRTAIATSFVAHAFSHSVGLALLTGAAVRLRAYADRGLDAAAVARVSAFVTGTVTLGLIATASVALLSTDAPVRVRHVAIAARPVGGILAVLVLAYVAWSALGTRSAIGSGRWRVQRPSPGLGVAQVMLSVVDWLLVGTLLYVLLPTALPLEYPTFLRAYLVAQAAGVASHVPGGAGVFEAVLLTLLAPAAQAGGMGMLAASLLTYRVIYYLVPLAVAIAVFVIAEPSGSRISTPPASGRA
jgi:uncharacterized membrane protein YbhN (UPF0104 family)